MTKAEHKALEAYVNSVRERFGPQLHDVLVFGSRARGDNRADSDVDLAIIFETADWDYWTRKFELLDMAWEALSEQGLLIQPSPLSKAAWDQPMTQKNARFVGEVRREAKPVAEAA